MKRNLILSFICMAVAGLPDARGQSITPSVINIAGGSGNAAGNTYEWSIGEPMINTFVSSSLIVTEGVLQPKVITTIVSSDMPAHRLDVFPNPATSVVNISFSAPAAGNLSYKLTDLLGRTLQEHTSAVKSGSNAYQLDIRSLACASYMLHVTYTVAGSKEESATYKIQKLN